MRSTLAALVFSLAFAPAWAEPANGAIVSTSSVPSDTSPIGASRSPPSGLLTRARDQASEMVFAAMNYVGVRYRRGGDSAETGFDCSGFTRHVFNMSLGLVLPRRADEQASAPGLRPVSRADLQPGDLVFFRTMKETFSHVGIYIGNNRFIHSPRTGEEVRTEDMGFAYWAKRFTGARRADLAATSPVTMVHAVARDASPIAEPGRGGATP